MNNAEIAADVAAACCRRPTAARSATGDLMDNALDAAESADGQPDIALTIQDDGESVVITVTDNGPGMAPPLHAEKKRRERNRAQVQRYRSRAESEPSLRYAVSSVLPEAMAQASGNGVYAVPTRTLYYRVRPLGQDTAAIVITSPSGMPRSLDATRTGVVRDTATALGRGNRRNTSAIAPHPERRETSPRLGQASAFNTEPR